MAGATSSEGLSFLAFLRSSDSQPIAHNVLISTCHYVRLQIIITNPSTSPWNPQTWHSRSVTADSRAPASRTGNVNIVNALLSAIRLPKPTNVPSLTPDPPNGTHHLTTYVPSWTRKLQKTVVSKLNYFSPAFNVHWFSAPTLIS